MSHSGTNPDRQTAEHTRHLTDIGGLPEHHPARLLWESKLADGECVDAGRIDEYHNALKRHINWLHKSVTDAIEGARLGLHAVIEHEVSDATEAGRQRKLIDLVARCYEESIV